MSQADLLTLGTAASVGGVIAGFLAMISLVGIAFCVLLIIAEWKIFTKAGEKGWKSLIPFYNLYIMFKLFWKTDMFWVVLGVSLGSSILAGICASADINAGILTFAAGVFNLIISIILMNRLSKSFGHGAGFTVGLIFLPNIFTLILGFNKDKYKKIKD